MMRILDVAIGRDGFLNRLAKEFPGVVANISQNERGLLHCEVSAFRRATEVAMDSGKLWEAERHFRLVEELLKDASPELRNALEVSYLEDLALGECTEQRHMAIKHRMPKLLRKILIEHDDRWQ